VHDDTASYHSDLSIRLVINDEVSTKVVSGSDSSVMKSFLDQLHLFTVVLIDWDLCRVNMYWGGGETGVAVRPGWQ
jgi:hypothetical protein